MRKSLTENKPTAVIDDSEKSVFSTRLRGKVRLPPLQTTVVIGSYGLLESTSHDDDEDRGNGGEIGDSIFSEKTCPSGADNLITPKVFKHPMSPSNLSIRFNFDDAPSKPKQLVACRTKDDKPRSRSRNCHKRLQSSTVRPNEESNGKPDAQDKPRHVDRNEKTPGNSPDVKTVKVGRYHTLSNASVVKSTSSARGRKTNGAKAMKSASFPPKRLSSRSRLDANTEDGQRKSSIYDLREFLSLPSDASRGKVSPVLKKYDSQKTSVETKGKNPVVVSKSSPKLSHTLHKKPSKDYMYDLFEFLALAEQEKPSTGKGSKKKLKRINAEKVSRMKSTKLSAEKAAGIPSVVVADWSLKDDFPIVSNKQPELPKVDFPRDDFPKSPEILLAPWEGAQRKSVYDLKEFLNLADLSRKGVAKVETQNLALPFNEGKPTTKKESEAQCDLREFLTFLESRALGNGGGSNSDMSSERPNAEAYRSRTISVYDIFEFLKTTSPTNFSQDGELQMHSVRTDDSTSSHDFHESRTNRKPSVINLMEFFTESSHDERPVKDKHKATGEINSKPHSSSSNSTYNLREFLGLPSAGVAQRSKAESESKTRSTFA